jgi:oxygen-independent coproporphyrinogen-3 oxidase
VADVRDYVERVKGGSRPAGETETVSADTDATERLIFGFRLTSGIDPNGVTAAAGLRRRWQGAFDRLAAQGLVEADGSRWRLTGRGRAFADHVGREFLEG